MNCEACGKNPATVHYTAWENNVPKEMHVCQPCAVDKGIVVVPTEKFSIQEPVISLLGDTVAAEAGLGKVQCERCGLLYSAFRDTGRLGCPGCYDSFDAQLKPLLRRIHGNLQHTGKGPLREEARTGHRNRIQKLQGELEKAIGRENFERAAELRDQLRRLREELGGLTGDAAVPPAAGLAPGADEPAAGGSNS
jgi:protein arginine kinase activator